MGIRNLAPTGASSVHDVSVSSSSASQNLQISRKPPSRPLLVPKHKLKPKTKKRNPKPVQIVKNAACYIKDVLKPKTSELLYFRTLHANAEVAPRTAGHSPATDVSSQSRAANTADWELRTPVTGRCSIQNVSEESSSHVELDIREDDVYRGSYKDVFKRLQRRLQTLASMNLKSSLSDMDGLLSRLEVADTSERRTHVRRTRKRNRSWQFFDDAVYPKIKADDDLEFKWDSQEAVGKYFGNELDVSSGVSSKAWNDSFTFENDEVVPKEIEFSSFAIPGDELDDSEGWDHRTEDLRHRAVDTGTYSHSARNADPQSVCLEDDEDEKNYEDLDTWSKGVSVDYRSDWDLGDLNGERQTFSLLENINGERQTVSSLEKPGYHPIGSVASDFLEDFEQTQQVSTKELPRSFSSLRSFSPDESDFTDTTCWGVERFENNFDLRSLEDNLDFMS